jgi:hypothetical protein
LVTQNDFNLSFLAFRRCAILSTFLVSALLYRKLPSFALSLSIIVIVAGALIAGWQNMERDYMGIAIVWINNFI